jgi:spore coat protein H
MVLLKQPGLGASPVLFSAVCLLSCKPRLQVSEDSGDVSAGSTQDSATQVSVLCEAIPTWEDGGSGLEAPFYLEEDRVQLGIECSQEIDESRVSFIPLEIPESATWNAEENQLLMDSNGGSGGRYELLFSVRIEDDTGFPATLSTQFWIGDNPDATDAVAPDPLSYTEEWGLPVFHVESDGSIGTSYENATIVFEGQSYPAEIQKRGAASISYPKNSFGLRFDEPELDLENQGIPQRRDHLVLITPFDDNSYIRQRLIYELWEGMADYWGVQRMTPRTFFAVMYLDGSYFGLFTASDRIDDEFALHMGLSKEGNLYKAINHDANFYLTTSGGSAKSSLSTGYEKKEGEPMSGDGAFDDLIELVEMTGSSSPNDFIPVADEWIQTDEFMDWYHLVQISVSYDSAGKNSYLYNDPGADEPFRYVPWDFNHSWGQDWRTFRVGYETDNDLTGTNAIFAHLLWGNSEELMGRYKAMRADGPLSDAWLLGEINDYWEELGPSIDRDWNKWGASYQSYSSWSGTRNSYGDWTTPQEERAYVEEWISARGAVFDSIAEGY